MLLVSVLFVLFSIAAEPIVWWSVFELLLQMSSGGGEEGDEFIFFTIQSEYNNPVVPISVLSVIVVLLRAFHSVFY